MRRYCNTGNILPATMAASAIMGFLTSMGFFMMAISPENHIAHMNLTPAAAVVSLGSTFTASVEIDATVPVNAFMGVVTFDPKQLQVSSIDYNTSIADLWAEEPWYKNGDGTIHFAGGTTRPGGFTGKGTALTITFTSIGSGEAPVRITDAQILQHDGLGTEALIDNPIDGLFTVAPPQNTAPLPAKETAVVVRDPKLTGDLNDDGVVSIGDVSIFFVYLTTSNTRADLNGDKRISTVDLSILISQM